MSRNSGYPRNSGYDRVDENWYVEPRWCVELLLDQERFDGEVLDPCCGSGTIPSVCLSRGIPARGSADRGFGTVREVFTLMGPVDNIISNVPYGITERCARHMLTLARRKVALILPMTFWESERRDQFFRVHPPVRWYVCSTRPSMPPGVMSGERDPYGAIIQPRSSGGTMPYGWFIWERGFKGITSALRLPLRSGTRY
jgi:hypothetical protein